MAEKGLGMNSNMCVVCGSAGASLLMIDDNTITVCKECGAIYMQNLNMIIQMEMPLKQDTNIYAVLQAMIDVKTHLSLEYATD